MTKAMKTVRINIQNNDDRKNMVIALANAGISVIVEEQKTKNWTTLYWVVFEITYNNINP